MEEGDCPFDACQEATCGSVECSLCNMIGESGHRNGL